MSKPVLLCSIPYSSLISFTLPHDAITSVESPICGLHATSRTRSLCPRSFDSNSQPFSTECTHLFLVTPITIILTPLCAHSHRRLRSLHAECSRFPTCLDGMEPSSHSYNPVDKSSFGLPPIPIHLQDHTQLFTLLTLLIYTRHKTIARYSGYTSTVFIRRPTH